MKPSKIVEFIVSRCWSGDEIRSTSFVLNDTFVLEGDKYKLDEKLLQDLIKYQEFSIKPYSVTRIGSDKVVSVSGKRTTI
ncbi:hypothetical protein [Paenibacillus sp. Marseille-Q4541]|uniref:hypothetical protein n=1 Tax=Paenibacillus sp. Marseille-Q4541 TaxID=2831522 RepID=UPI001BACB7C4|nr:hypothetical protein [Paenibacillus sp. Marseille-Q4541]